MKTKLLLITLITSLVLLSACAPLTTTPQDTTAQTQGIEATQAQTEATEATEVPQETTAQTAGEIATEEATEQATEEATEAETRPPVDIVNGEFTTNGYAVSQVDGLYYLNFAEGNQANSSGGGYYYDPYLYCESVKELRDKLLYGDFDESEREHIKLLFPKNENGISLFNVEKMFDFVYPEGMKGGTVSWLGDQYSQGMMEPTDPLAKEVFRATITVIPREGYERGIAKYGKNFFSWVAETKIISHEIGEWEGFPCETYVYETSLAQLKAVMVEVPEEAGGNIRYIYFKYLLSHSREDFGLSVSDTRPQQVWVFGECEGQTYEMLFMDCATTPTYEALSAYGITPYVE